MNKPLTITLLLAFFVISCKKEKTNWDTNWSAPLVHGHLTLDNLIPSEYTTTNSENYISIVYNESVFSFSVDTLVNLPDTTITQKSAIGAPNLNVNPGFTYGDAYNQAYDLDEIELKQVLIKSGEVELTIRSPWPGKSKVTFDFPSITNLGVPFLETFFLEAGSQSNPSTASGVIDMSGFLMDLTGTSGNLINTISGDIVMGSNESTDTYVITNTDSVEYDITFSNLKPDYAKGYFGSYTLSDTTGFDLPFMNSVLAGAIDIDSIDLTISIMNGFNLIAQAKITLLRGISSISGGTVDLNFPQLNNNININPATGGLYNWAPSEYPLTINNSNSNITNFLENLSDSILLGYELKINPDGNVTAGSDELFPGSAMELFVNGEFPLNFAASNLTLTDTFNVSYNGSTSYTGREAVITLAYENSFPLGANTTLYLLDNDNTVIDQITGDSGILSGAYSAGTYTTTPYSGQVIFTLTEQNILNLQSTSRVAMVVAFDTDNNQKVKIDANAFLDFSLRSNLQISLHL